MSVTVHKALNSCRDVVSDKELMMASESEIIEGLSNQGVIAARRINIRRGNDIIPTKHVILTFSSSKLPSSITAGYIRSPVKPYIPNTLRYFNCQRSGTRRLLVEANLHVQIAELPVIQQMVARQILTVSIANKTIRPILKTVLNVRLKRKSRKLE
ncbi:hypothetical protein AVEN_16861-1 [Araneus ventricosus]|uniref:Uncharacterized protein n=1 Tax=Araneus ventricosus TaxID=182803 RepID=A0A4Y2F8B0_ARAVE|nr:hypothetical protein AVEN_16861-1 [Araneus ventricosus]